MLRIFVHREGRTEAATRIDPAWLLPDSGVVVWVDLSNPSPIDAVILTDTFKFHPLAVEDALSKREYPKIEAYDGYLYLILHAIDFKASQHRFGTHDVDFFLGSTYLVTVHGDESVAANDLADLCVRNTRILGEGAAALLHRIIDGMVDRYLPEVEKLEDRLDALEKSVLARPDSRLIGRILEQKRDVASLRRVVMPQRDAISRLARREFGFIDVEIAYRFRDVYDHLVRLVDEAMVCQDRITGILDAHLSNVAKRQNQVMPVLTVIATIFMPLTVLTGVWGMNVALPMFPGGTATQFWWLFGIMILLSGTMLVYFRLKRWI